LGVVSKDPSVKIKRDELEISQLAVTQKELLLAAIDAVDWKSSLGGIIVYSTCTISVEENEYVVNRARKFKNSKYIIVAKLEKAGSDGSSWEGQVNRLKIAFGGMINDNKRETK